MDAALQRCVPHRTCTEHECGPGSGVTRCRVFPPSPDTVGQSGTRDWTQPNKWAQTTQLFLLFIKKLKKCLPNTNRSHSHAPSSSSSPCRFPQANQTPPLLHIVASISPHRCPRVRVQYPCQCWCFIGCDTPRPPTLLPPSFSPYSHTYTTHDRLSQTNNIIFICSSLQIERATIWSDTSPSHQAPLKHHAFITGDFKDQHKGNQS
ncbi:hypothetical protein JHK82_018266 [Glycine max]|nr:hypothetical protein JHK82_018266 [Glycine max]